MCGASIGANRDMHFRQADLELVGRRFAETLLDMADPEQAAVQAALIELAKLLGDRSGGGGGTGADAGGEKGGEGAASTKEDRRAKRRGSKGRRKRRG